MATASGSAATAGTVASLHKLHGHTSDSEMVKVWRLEVPPPGAGLKTVTAAIPLVAMSADGIAAVSCVAETNVVGRSAPFQRTTELAMKFVPFTVSVKADPPTMAELGARLLVVGTGLLDGGACVVNTTSTQ